MIAAANINNRQFDLPGRRESWKVVTPRVSARWKVLPIHPSEPLPRALSAPVTNRHPGIALRLGMAVLASAGLHWVAIKSFDWWGGNPRPAVRLGAPSELQVSLTAIQQPGHVPPAVKKQEERTAPIHQAPAKKTQPQAKDNSPTETAAGQSGNIFGPWYFQSRYLHRRPTPLKPIQPDYPPEAASLSGRVLLLLFLSDSGSVDKFEIVESEPKGVFDDSAIKAFTGEIYAPGLIAGYPVRSQLLVEVTYAPGLSPQMTSVIPEQATPK